MKVVSYLAGIPPKNKNLEKPALLKNYIAGVEAVGDQGIVWEPNSVMNQDVAVLQGFIHEASPNSPHLKLRREVLDHQIRTGGRTVVVDSNLFLYMNKHNPGNYLRYSFDGVFPTTAEYCWDNPDPARWQKISRDLGLVIKPWRTTGSHILICMQRNGGWSMKGKDAWEWLSETVKDIRRYSDRPIIVRGHPGDAKTKRVIQQRRYPGNIPMDNLYFSDLDKRELKEDLRNCWATVVYNSSPAVASAIEGVPVFVYDKDDCQAGDVANTNLNNLESPEMFDRVPWLQKISMCHWNFDDLRSGACWKHMKGYV